MRQELLGQNEMYYSVSRLSTDQELDVTAYGVISIFRSFKFDCRLPELIVIKTENNNM